MYKVYFYKDEKGREPIKEYLQELKGKNNKDSRIKLTKYNDYIEILAQYGLNAGEPYIKHIDKNLWELRPVRDRVLFVTWSNNSFILLHHFTKKTQKTPKKEIETAKRKLEDLLSRGIKYD